MYFIPKNTIFHNYNIITIKNILFSIILDCNIYIFPSCGIVVVTTIQKSVNLKENQTFFFEDILRY